MCLRYLVSCERPYLLWQPPQAAQLQIAPNYQLVATENPWTRLGLKLVKCLQGEVGIQRHQLIYTEHTSYRALQATDTHHV